MLANISPATALDEAYISCLHPFNIQIKNIIISKLYAKVLTLQLFHLL